MQLASQVDESIDGSVDLADLPHYDWHWSGHQRSEVLMRSERLEVSMRSERLEVSMRSERLEVSKRSVRSNMWDTAAEVDLAQSLDGNPGESSDVDGRSVDVDLPGDMLGYDLLALENSDFANEGVDLSLNDSSDWGWDDGKTTAEDVDLADGLHDLASDDLDGDSGLDDDQLLVLEYLQLFNQPLGHSLQCSLHWWWGPLDGYDNLSQLDSHLPLDLLDRSQYQHLLRDVMSPVEVLGGLVDSWEWSSNRHRHARLDLLHDEARDSAENLLDGNDLLDEDLDLLDPYTLGMDEGGLAEWRDNGDLPGELMDDAADLVDLSLSLNLLDH